MTLLKIKQCAAVTLAMLLSKVLNCVIFELFWCLFCVIMKGVGSLQWKQCNRLIDQGPLSGPGAGAAGQQHGRGEQLPLQTLQRALQLRQRPHAQLPQNYSFAQV